MSEETDPEYPSPSERELHLCTQPGCNCDSVYPVDWEEAEPDHWRVELRCPECEHREEGVYSQEQVEAFDEELEYQKYQLKNALRRLTRSNLR